MNKSKSIWILASYWFSHMVVDFICAATIFTIYVSWLLATKEMLVAILSYNILAFWTQIIFWSLEDKFECPKLFAICWCILVVLWSLLLNIFPRISVILIWLWNSLFHVWWGIISIATAPEKAAPAWIFVAPWALGLLLWTLLWKSWNFIYWYSLILWWISCIFMLLSSKKSSTYSIINSFAEKESVSQKQLQHILVWIILLLVLSIIIRSFIWFIINYPWKAGTLLIIFTVCIVLWKAFWWIIADRFWWIRTWVSSLLLSLPCLLLWSHYIIFWMIGIFLFNITMSIALAWLIKVMPKRWGLAFGILCMWLLVWSVPVLLGCNFSWIMEILLIILILISSCVLYIALNKLGIKK